MAGRNLDPRVARSRARICDAVIELLQTTGYDGLSMEGIADAASVGKATLYRHYGSPGEVVTAALTGFDDVDPPARTGDSFADVLTILIALSENLVRSDWAGLLPAVMEAAGRNDQLDRRVAQFIAERRRPIVGILTDAVAAGDLPPGTDPELAADLFAGPLFYMRFVRREPADADAVAVLARTAWRGLGGTLPAGHATT